MSRDGRAVSSGDGIMRLSYLRACEEFSEKEKEREKKMKKEEEIKDKRAISELFKRMEERKKFVAAVKEKCFGTKSHHENEINRSIRIYRRSWSSSNNKSTQSYTDIRQNVRGSNQVQVSPTSLNGSTNRRHYRESSKSKESCGVNDRNHRFHHFQRSNVNHQMQTISPAITRQRKTNWSQSSPASFINNSQRKNEKESNERFAHHNQNVSPFQRNADHNLNRKSSSESPRSRCHERKMSMSSQLHRQYNRRRLYHNKYERNHYYSHPTHFRSKYRRY